MICANSLFFQCHWKHCEKVKQKSGKDKNAPQLHTDIQKHEGQAVLTFSSSPKAVAAMNSFYGSLKMVCYVCHLSSTNVVLQITKDI